MNDDKLTAAVRQSVDGVHMNVPAQDIISRARTIRSRRRIPVAAAALTFAAGAALGVTALAAPSQSTRIQLTAWTVVNKPGGQIGVTIRELRDPAGLQRRLRADGIPATVRFEQFEGRGPYPRKVPNPCFYSAPDRRITRLLSKIFPVSTSTRHQVFLTINPSAIPVGIGVWIEIVPPGRSQPEDAAWYALDYASGRCPAGKASGAVFSFAFGVPRHK